MWLPAFYRRTIFRKVTGPIINVPTCMRGQPTVWLSQLSEGFVFALFDAQLVKKKSNGSLASATDSKAIDTTTCSVQRKQLGGGGK